MRDGLEDANRLQCRACGEACEADSNFCEACGARLRHVWVCPQCGETNRLGALSCVSCEWLRHPRRVPPAERCRSAAVGLLLALTVLGIGWMVASDIKHGRHFLSTKDGRFQREAASQH